MARHRPRGLDPLVERDEPGPAFLQRGLVPPLRLVAELLGLVRESRRAEERAQLIGLRQARRLVDPERQVLERPRRAVLRILDGAPRALGEAHDRRANLPVQDRGRLRVRLRIREPAEPVARVHEREGQIAQPLESEAALDRLPHGLGRRRVRQRFGEPCLPGAVEEEAGGERIGHREARIHAGLDGALAQEPGRERVDRPDPGGLELPERLVEAGPGQLAPEAHAEVGGRLLGERDGRDLAEARSPAPDEVHDATQEERGLPAAGRRLDQERGVEILDRAAALVVVDEQSGRIAEIEASRPDVHGTVIRSRPGSRGPRPRDRRAWPPPSVARSAPHARSKAHGPRAQAPGRWKNRPARMPPRIVASTRSKSARRAAHPARVKRTRIPASGPITW